MSLHIGGKKEIAEKKILFILDYEQAFHNADTSIFLKNNCEAQKEDSENTQTTKSIVVTEKDGKIEIYCSPISSVTLAGRCRYEWTE